MSDYPKDGFLIKRALFSKERVTEIKDLAFSIFQKQFNKLGCSEKEELAAMRWLFENHFKIFQNCGKHAQHLIKLHQLSLSAEILEVLEKELLLSFVNICTRPVLFFNHKDLAKKEIYYKTPPHQDYYSMQGSEDSIVVWIPLVPQSLDIGVVEIVPQSHKQGLLTSGVENSFGLTNAYGNNDFKPLEVTTGDAVFFSSFLVHRSGNNISDKIRWSCHFRYNNLDDSAFIDRGFPHPYIYYSEGPNGINK